ncbi:luciferase- subgroup [Colletotrichum plurivorum]|uniref:Luciferase- subgroup n=1 Tax=Colletotrichum plurivorum TaxID=2175906 RepID=A0A8H6NKP9_9PEZI|nr:luciferase- subgroup [Colletotrichum plurivorum]
MAQPHPLNTDPDRLLFAYWVPNVSGGLIISKIEQKTNWDLASNIKYAKAAEKAGIEYGLTQIRFTASYGAANQHESVSFSQAILQGTDTIKIIAAILPGPWNPTVAAKQIASIDHYSNGRIAVNIVSGWFKGEFTAVGEWWLEHAERYRRSNEFIRCLKGIWTAPKGTGFTFGGDFYRYRDYKLSPKPVQKPHPEIFQGGNSDDARNNGAEVSDWYFMNGNDLEGFRAQIADVKARAAKVGREGELRFAVNGFVIVRETEEEAVRVLREIQGKADAEAVGAFRDAVQQAGASTANKTGMWADSTFDDLVQYNDGFKTKLIGTKEQVAERLVLLKSLGINLVLTAFLHYDDEIEQFGRDVLPLVRQYEKEGRGKNAEFEIERTGAVYQKR